MVLKNTSGCSGIRRENSGVRRHTERPLLLAECDFLGSKCVIVGPEKEETGRRHLSAQMKRPLADGAGCKRELHSSAAPHWIPALPLTI